MAFAVGACGGDDSSSNADDYEGEEADVAAVIDDLGEAARDGDGNRICDELFTRNLAISITRASKRACAQQVVDNLFDEDAEFDVQDLGVVKNEATVRVTDQNDQQSLLLLQKSGGEWRIARIS